LSARKIIMRAEPREANVISPLPPRGLVRHIKNVEGLWHRASYRRRVYNADTPTWMLDIWGWSNDWQDFRIACFVTWLLCLPTALPLQVLERASDPALDSISLASITCRYTLFTSQTRWKYHQSCHRFSIQDLYQLPNTWIDTIPTIPLRVFGISYDKQFRWLANGRELDAPSPHPGHFSEVP
jgi:hypothetical protein